MSRVRRLQVMQDGQWRWVFCRNAQTGAIVTTNNPDKALPDHALETFERRFADHQFRVARP